MPLTLKFADARPFPQPLTARWRGCAAEHVVIPSSDAFEFSHSGDCHYLAFHDIRLADGELKIDTLPVVRERELRETVTFVPKGCTLSGWSRPAPRRNAFTAVYFKPEELHHELEARYSPRPLEPVLYSRDPSLTGTLRKIEWLVRSPGSDPLLAESLCLTAALEVFGILASPETGQLSERQMALVRAFIDAHIDQPITLSDLAGAVGLSRFHFSRAFKATTGEPPYRFVAGLRVEAACRILVAAPHLSIDDTAASVGFSSAAQFRRAFQNRIGMTPQAFRRQSS